MNHVCFFKSETSCISGSGVLAAIVPMKSKYNLPKYFEHTDFPGVNFYLARHGESEALIVSVNLVSLAYVSQHMGSVKFFGRYDEPKFRELN